MSCARPPALQLLWELESAVHEHHRLLIKEQYALPLASADPGARKEAAPGDL